MADSGEDLRFFGCDFGGSAAAGEQAKKILLVEAVRDGPRRYVVRSDGLNARLLQRGSDGRPAWWTRRRGFTAPRLLRELSGVEGCAVGAFDFPFSLPAELLRSAEFARAVGVAEAFGTRCAWLAFVRRHLTLSFDEPTAGSRLDMSAFAGWRDKRFWVKRATDHDGSAQPPLKHLYQNLFGMTLVGAALLGELEAAGWHIDLAPGSLAAAARRAIETYPAGIARAVGFTGSYKREPAGAVLATRRWLARNGIELDLAPPVEHVIRTYRSAANDPDAADAFLCLVAAIAHREGLSRPLPGDADGATLAQEGCIRTLRDR